MAQEFQLELITERAGGGDPIVRRRQVVNDRLTIGRAPENDIVLADLTVDPWHATLTAAGGQVTLEAVADQTFTQGGKPVSRAVVSPSANPEFVFGSYTLGLSPGEAGAIVVKVTRKDDYHAPEPTIFSLQSRILTRRNMAWTLAVGVLLVCLLIPIFGSGVFKQKIHPDQQWSSGPLSEAHAFLETDCKACHQKAFVSVRDNACLACHGKGQPAAMAEADARVHAKGSPLRAVAVSEHGQWWRGPDERHKRLGKGTPTADGLPARVQAVFNHPTDRCASCHVEHTQGQGGRLEKPKLVAVNSCESCHTDLAKRMKSRGAATLLVDTPSWTKHPAFHPLVTRNGQAERMPPRLWLASNQGGPPREANGLIFPHDLHVDPQGGPARLQIALGKPGNAHSPVACAACHVPDGRGNFKPITMEGQCEACHSLAIARNPDGSLKKLLHEAPDKVLADLNAFYRNGGQAQAMFRRAFQPGGACVDCHSISWTAQGLPVVAPVHLAQRFMPASDFNHDVPKHGGGSTDSAVCLDCHRAAGTTDWRMSRVSSDLLMPDKAQCATCHGKPKSAKTGDAGGTCETCHSFHAPAAAACQPADRPLKALTWGQPYPPRCERKRDAPLQPPKA